MDTCQHKNITLIGNEEDGAKSFFCEDCTHYLQRIVEDGEYVYITYEPAIYVVTVVGAEDEKFTWLFSARDSDEACLKAQKMLVETFEDFADWTEECATAFVMDMFSFDACKLDKTW